ncbi:hypothetical protein CQ12_22700 [Bradyrhizobium jicamae]|uniref:Uncharacterized protein n=1 Tax=Bradyrhizobium jicamae TaxID=280332 RepID=A0A0R3L4N2_9BRAD|nr:hypothetical protein [Bradyrhizobium jicamae]KRR02920.1 hypothetical protein CQ12_22700 [Bradyrhizobium jicamae]
MKSLIGTAFVAAALAIAAPAAIDSAAAAPQTKAQRAGVSGATDFSAHRHVRRYNRHYGNHRPHYHRSYYYARPVYYRPYPYDTPAPFTFGIGFGPSWW